MKLARRAIRLRAIAMNIILYSPISDIPLSSGTGSQPAKLRDFDRYRGDILNQRYTAFPLKLIDGETASLVDVQDSLPVAPTDEMIRALIDNGGRGDVVCHAASRVECNHRGKDTPRA